MKLRNKLISAAIKASGFLMAFTFVITQLSQDSISFFTFHQPEVPASMLENDEE